MSKLTLPAAAALLTLLFEGASMAASLDVAVIDQGGKPVESAVVSLNAPTSGTAPPALATQAVINQNFETFFPLVTILPVGGSVVFRNSDRTMHQVYSFSAIKRFAFEVDVGQTTPTVKFDKPGIAAIGCNIHDQMITYVVVTDNPYTKLSSNQGIAHFDALPPGHYSVAAWHPDLAPGARPSSGEVDVGQDGGKISLVIKLLPRRMAPMSHMGAY